MHLAHGRLQARRFVDGEDLCLPRVTAAVENVALSARGSKGDETDEVGWCDQKLDSAGWGNTG